MRSCFQLLLLAFVFSFQIATAQTIERLYNISPTDTASNYTLVIKPASKTQGMILIFPGFGEKPADVLKETSLPTKAANAGYVVAIPYISNNTALSLTDAKQKQVDQLIQNLKQKYKLQRGKLIVGGFSMGGTAAVKFAEYSLTTSTSPKVHALFAVDPLLDLERFERAVQKAVHRSKASGSKRMMGMLQSMLIADFGSTPLQTPEKYYNISPYAYSDTTCTAIKPLRHLPILIFSEPDAENQFNANHRDLYDLNTADCTAMIADLQSMGNGKATLILTTGKGRRADGTLNPHAWSILQVDKTISWLNSL
ncbi:alpha/beta hydrolase [Pontibacter cellulosilyticus]|uniref:Alpha/beta hydrolase n=1 Tax=Pontibacter cellulosilyticus TaxID=1720253 RepID=A0A923N5G4_9BACT|nr:alpha/beta hydrolase [Pontibacter cellulosilyticus]MBC5992953.1 alpha/beta hydrolase [Pontibacter cellulosilyticus]